MNKFPPRHVKMVDGRPVVHPPIEKNNVPAIGADIRVYERLDKEVGVPAPHCININGVELLTTEDSTVEVETIKIGHAHDLVVVNIKGIICRSFVADQEVVEPEPQRTDGVIYNGPIHIAANPHDIAASQKTRQQKPGEYLP